jgi:hypothetical protein
VALPLAGVLAVKALVFCTAMICLDVLGHRTLAVLFGVLVTANTVIATLDREAAFLKMDVSPRWTGMSR